MKKHYIFKLTILLIPVMAFVLMSNSGGKSGGFSGSPGDNNSSCTTCHGGANLGGSVALQSEVPAEGYELNTSYGLQVDISDSSGSIYGFQLTAEKVSDGSKVGTFTTSGSDTQLTNSNGNVVQTTAGNSQKSWNVNWKAPSTDVGEVKFYVSAVVGNDDNSFGGDQVVSTSSSNIGVLSISEVNRLDFDMYPNPASESLTIQLPSSSDKAIVQFYDYVGKLTLTKNVTNSNNKIDINGLSTGVYILKVLSDDKVGSQKFIKR